MPCERRSEIPSEGDARRCSYEVHVAPCAGVGAAVVDRRSAAAVVVGWKRSALLPSYQPDPEGSRKEEEERRTEAVKCRRVLGKAVGYRHSITSPVVAEGQCGSQLGSGRVQQWRCICVQSFVTENQEGAGFGSRRRRSTTRRV